MTVFVIGSSPIARLFQAGIAQLVERYFLRTVYTIRTAKIIVINFTEFYRIVKKKSMQGGIFNELS